MPIVAVGVPVELGVDRFVTIGGSA